MNKTIHPDGAPDLPWPSSNHRVRVPDTSMLPGSEKAAPAAQQLGERVSAAGDTIHAKTDPLRDTRDEWVESVRTTVRSRQRGLMNAVWMLIAALVILPAVGLVAWALTDQSRQPNEDSGAFLLERTP